MLNTAVVILNYNTRHQLEQFLPSVKRYSAFPNVQVVVADNGSTDDSVAWMQSHQPEITLIRLDKNYGFAAGYNEALKQVKADIFVLLNSDVEVSSGWLTTILKVFERDKNIAAVQPKILSYHRKSHFEYAGAAGGWIDSLGYPFCKGRVFDSLEEDTGQYDQPSEIFWASGAAMFIRAELFRQFNGFDGDYFAHLEEIDLCQRLKLAGYRILYEPSSVVYHVGGGTLNYQHPRKTYLNFRNSWTTILKNEPFGKLLWLIPTRLALDMAAAAFFIFKKEAPQAVSVIKAIFFNFRHLSRVLKKRKVVRDIIAKYRIGPSDQAGIYKGSLVFQYYIKKVKLFSALIK